MQTLILAFVLIALLMTGMAVGVLLGRKPLKGSCGGLQQLGMKGDCDICGGQLDQCEENQRRQQGQSADLAYNAVQGTATRKTT